MDIEASGFGPDSYPIEVGVVKSSGDRYCTLIEPHKSWSHWCHEAEQLHGISPDMLCTKGKPVRDVCLELNDFLKEDTVFSDAWSHDQAWLAKLYRAANMHPSFTIRAIEFILNEAQLQAWDQTKKCIRKYNQGARHRASNDAHLIQLTYLECMMKEKASAPSSKPNQE